MGDWDSIRLWHLKGEYLRTELLRKQHTQILKLAAELQALIDSSGVNAGSAASIRELLERLATILEVHLQIEDDVLYPSLVTDSDSAIATIATKYKNEMGGLASTFASFMKAWRVPGSIEPRPSKFMSESESVFKLLTIRIEREENSLYPLLDSKKTI